MYDNSKGRLPYDIREREDYEYLRPCCGSTEYIVAKGITLNGVASGTTGTTTSNVTITTGGNSGSGNT